MTNTAQAENPEIELSCREAHLILRVTPLLKNVSEMKKEEISAIMHYIYCKDCRDQGLADILLDTKLSCKQAILVWAGCASALWLDCSPTFSHRIETLVELYATEHVWGKYQWKDLIGDHGWDISTRCCEYPCQALHCYWANVPMSSSAGDGPSGVIHLFPFLFETFLKEKWTIGRLLALQKKRVADVLKDIKSGKITVSSNHYHSTDELMAEVQKHIAILQKLAVHSNAQVAPA